MKSIRVAKIRKAVAAVAAVVATLSVPAQAHADPKVLTDNAGMTVYTFDKDHAGKSTCYVVCASTWPPVTPESMLAGSEFSAIARDDGTKQAVYHGKPLYLFAGDKKPGDVNGDNVHHVWHTIPTGSATKAAQATPAAGSYGSGYSYGY